MFCTELLTCLTDSATALMSFKSWPWRSRRRSDTPPTSTGPLQTAMSFKQLYALSVDALSRIHFAKHDGFPDISR